MNACNRHVTRNLQDGIVMVSDDADGFLHQQMGSKGQFLDVLSSCLSTISCPAVKGVSVNRHLMSSHFVMGDNKCSFFF